MKYDVVIIDNGCMQIDEDFLETVDLRIEKSETPELIPHGHDLVQLIHERSPDSQILMLKICDYIDDFSCEDIFRAFDFLLENNMEFDILNMSLGAQYACHEQFQLYIDKFVERDVVILAANHSQTMSYPAILNGVIGVDVSNYFNNPNQYVYNQNSVIDLIGANCYVRVQHNDHYTLGKGSSYITAHFAGILSKEFKKNAKLYSSHRQHAHDFLKENATHVKEFDLPLVDKGKDFVKKIKKAIVFPVNKETIQLAMAEDLLPFEVCGYYDFDISLNNFHFADERIKGARHVLILPFSQIDWNDTFDTVICGHCLEYDRITHNNVLSSIIKKSIKHGKKLYCFDYLIGIPEEGSDLYFPHVTKSMLRQDDILNVKLYNINKPILAIMGTSSVQGKYNLQISLRKNFIQRGYRVSNIGSEPSGYLFGFDAVIPFGYNSHVDLSSREFVRYLNENLKQAESNSPDIIIIGSQSGTAPFVNNNLEYLFMRQQELLLGTNPDAVVLCVNYFDSEEYIFKTINLIESLCSGKVIALYISALEMPKQGRMMRNRRNLIDAIEMERYAKNIEEKTGLPVFSMLEPIDALAESIINYFST